MHPGKNMDGIKTMVVDLIAIKNQVTNAVKMIVFRKKER